jgi:tRNA A-37 threonylcarbamoyl transferase component Bud32
MTGDLVGRQLGEYRIEATLGRGGMGQVYRARHETLDRTCAVKILSAQLVADTIYRGRFLQEARAVARLSHSNIVTVYDAGVIDGAYYIAMQYVDGVSLTERMAQAPLTLDEVLAIAQPVAAALDYAHAQGLVHRDVKPGNILIRSDGHVFLADFGIARATTQDIRLTTSGVLVGTPAYMAPEQITGGEVTAQTDIYQLGVTLFELLTGQSPYDERTPQALLLAHFQEQHRPAHSLNPALSADISQVLDRALRKLPTDRYQTAGEFVGELQRTIEMPKLHLAETVPAAPAGGAARSAGPDATTVQPPVAVDPATPPATSAELVRHRRRWYALGGGLALAVLALAAFWYAPWDERNGAGGNVIGTPESGPPAIGEVIDVADFEQLWPQEFAESDYSDIVDGLYYLVLNTPDDGVMQQALGVTLGDGKALLDVMMAEISGTYQEACLLARLERSADVIRGYRYCLTDSAELYASYVEFDPQGGLLSEEELLRFGVAAGTRAPTDWNELELIAQGDALWFGINGTIAGAIRHDGPPTGDIGIAVQRDGDGEAKFAFTALKVFELQGE